MLEQQNTAGSARFDFAIFELQCEISKTLANPIRLAVLYVLKDGERTVNELVQNLGLSQSNVSQHLAILRQRQIVRTRKAGSTVYYSVSSPKISQACNIVREVLLEQLDQKRQMAKTYSP